MHKFSTTDIDWNDDDSAIVSHKGDEHEVSHAAADLDSVHDSLEEYLRHPSEWHQPVPSMVSPMSIWVMRHGKTALDMSKRSDGYIDLPLSDEGRSGVVAAYSDFLKAVPFTHIFCSDLQRTHETGHIISSGMSSHPPIIIHNGLKTWNLGLLAGDVKKSNKKIVEGLLKNPDQAPPDGDPYDQFIDVFDGAIRAQQHALESGQLKGPILDVCSGSNCRRLSELLLGDRKILNVDEAGIIMMYPCGNGKWSAVVISGGGQNGDEDS